MKLTILGSGTGFPSAVRGGPGYLVQSGNTDLIMDFGMGTLSKLSRLGISLKTLGPILITHLHPDHTAELVSLFFALKNVGIGRRERLQLIGCRGLHRLLENLQGVYGDWIRPGDFPLEILELERGEIALKDFNISAIPVEHTKESVGFRIKDASGKILAYSGDSDLCPGLIDLARDADLALIECSFPDARKCPGHMTPSEVGKIAREAGAKKVVLTHFYPECEEVDLTTECRRYYSGEVVMGRGFMELHL